MIAAGDAVWLIVGVVLGAGLVVVGWRFDMAFPPRRAKRPFWPNFVAMTLVLVLFWVYLAEIARTPPWVGIVFGGLLLGTAASLDRLTRERPVRRMFSFAIAYSGLMLAWITGGGRYVPLLMALVVGILVVLVFRPVLPKRERVGARPSALPPS